MVAQKGRTDANVVATAVQIAGGPRRVAQLLGVSRSQVYRWISARTMARAIYVHVAMLARVSEIKMEFLGGSATKVEERVGLDASKNTTRSNSHSRNRRRVTLSIAEAANGHVNGRSKHSPEQFRHVSTSLGCEEKKILAMNSNGSRSSSQRGSSTQVKTLVDSP